MNQGKSLALKYTRIHENHRRENTVAQTDLYDRDSEEYLLGSMMVDSQIIPSLVEILGSDRKVFFIMQHQLIYDAILKTHEVNDGQVDAVLVYAELERVGTTNRAGGHLYLYDITARIPETANAQAHAKHVKELALRRETLSNADRLRAAAADISIPQQQIDDMLLAESARIKNRQTADGETVITDTVPFPESVMTGVFDEYWRAYYGCTEVSKSFLFGTLKTVIGASLGRRVSLAGTTPLYPNFFTCCIGHTALARKSTALALAESVLETADPGVFTLRSAATPEGLLAALKLPDFDNEVGGLHDNSTKIEVMRDQIEEGVEGVRLQLSIDEFSHLLKKAGKTHGDGLIQMLATAYNMPTKLQHPTRIDPLVADRPCVSLIGATTLHWLESSLKLEDIQGGFANRITYYLGSESHWLFEDQPGDVKRLQSVAKEINALRLKYPVATRFRFDQETAVAGQKWYESLRQELNQEQNPLVVMASARTDVHVKKLALLFSCIENMPDDHQIHLEAFEKALVLADYLQKVVAHLYQNFNFSEEKRLETKIVEVLNGKPRLTAREISKRISWASTKQVNEAVDQLLKSGALGVEQAGRTQAFFVMPDWS